MNCWPYSGSAMLAITMQTPKHEIISRPNLWTRFGFVHVHVEHDSKCLNSLSFLTKTVVDQIIPVVHATFAWIAQTQPSSQAFWQTTVFIVSERFLLWFHTTYACQLSEQSIERNSWKSSKQIAFWKFWKFHEPRFMIQLLFNFNKALVCQWRKVWSFGAMNSAKDLLHLKKYLIIFVQKKRVFDHARPKKNFWKYIINIFLKPKNFWRAKSL